MKNFYFFILSFLILFFPYCTPRLNFHKVGVDIIIDFPELTERKYADYHCDKISLSLYNLNTGDTLLEHLSFSSFPITHHLEVRPDLYEITFAATFYNNIGSELRLVGYYKDAVIGQSGQEEIYEIAVSPLSASNNFVISELFVSGTIAPQTGKQYTGDKYFVISNNSDTTLYCDGLLLLESKLVNSSQYTLEPDFRNDIFAVCAIYQIPGSGTDHPVLPGDGILIADNAINHTINNNNSFDLSNADFEWYDISSVASVTDIDNPNVTNLNKIFCYSNSIWIPSNQGNRSYAIARMPSSISIETFIKDYTFNFDYVTVTSAGAYPQTAEKTYKIPNEWIIDAVNLCPRTQYQWGTLGLFLDAGYAYVAETGDDKNRYGKCVRRKTQTSEKNMTKFVDDNNSSTDFLHSQTADPYYFKNR